MMLFQHDTPINRLLNLAIMNGGGKLVEETVTGNPVSFETEVAKPLVSFSVPFSPVQAGSGDPSPDNVRAISGFTGITAYRTGKNLLNVVQSNLLYKSSNAMTVVFDGPGKITVTFPNGTNLCTFGVAKITPAMVGTTFVFSGNNVASGTDIFVLCDADGGNRTQRNNPYTIAAADVGRTLAVRVWRDSAQTVTFSDMQVEVGSTPTAYEPYSGATFPVVFPAMGKNLFDGQYPDIKTTSALTYRALYVGDGTFTASTNMPLGEYGSIFFLPGNVSTGASTGGNNVNLNVPRTATAVDGYVTIAYRAYGTDPRAYNVQIEKGSSATAYEPYTTTAYGGTLDLVSGVLSVTYEGQTKTWGQIKSERTSGGYQQGNIIFEHPIPISGETGASATYQMCNVAKYQWADFNGTSHFYTATQNNDYLARIQIPEETADDTGITVVAKLKEPYTIQLDPVTIQTLIGSNTIWTDTNGTNEITYMKKG